jgi:type I restriction enzyme S subunit
MPVQIPPLPIQKAIAGTLSCLDAKIELNSKSNRNLEAQAQAIFKSWFVDFEPFQDGGFVKSELGFIPEGWRVGKLEEIAQITMGQSPKGTTYNEDGVGEVFYQGRAEFGWRFPSRRLFTTDPKRMAEKNDVLMSVRAPVGDINVANESCCIGRGLASLRNTTYPSFLLYLMHSIKERLNQFNAEGTVFGSINQGSLKSMAVIIPPDNVVYQFENNVASFDQMIWSLSKQNSTLVALRDTLLPKLMSGEIEVPVD